MIDVFTAAVLAAYLLLALLGLSTSVPGSGPRTATQPARPQDRTTR